MSEAFSRAYVSGDLGQALAIRNGVAFIFDGSRVNEATTGEINMFFDMSMEFHQLQPKMVEFLDDAGLADYLRRATAAADAVRFLLFGMDRELSDELRLSSIEQAGELLTCPDVRQLVQKRFLRLADPGDWDGRAAAILATLIDADLPSLLYLAAGDAAQLEELQSIDPMQWPIAEAKARLVHAVAGKREDVARQPIWHLAADWLKDPPPALILTPAHWFVRRFGSVPIPPIIALVSRAMIVLAAERYSRTREVVGVVAMLDEAISRTSSFIDDRFQPITAMAMVCKASILARHDRVAEAQAINSQAIDLVADRTDRLALEWKAEAQFAVAWNHGTLGERQQASEQYKKLVRTFGEHRSPRIRILVAKAMYNRANSLLALGNLPQAQEAFLEIDSTLEPDGVYDLDIVLAKARYNLACVSDRLGNQRTAVSLFDMVARSCSDSFDNERLTLWQDALYNRGTIFGRMGDHQRAIELYREVLSAIGETQDADRRLLAAQAMLNLALSYEATSAMSQALTAYEAIVVVFASIPEALGIVLKARAYLHDIQAARASDVGLAAPEPAPEDESSSAYLASLFGLDNG